MSMWKKIRDSILHASTRQKILVIVLIAVLASGVGVAAVKLGNSGKDPLQSANVEQMQKEDGNKKEQEKTDDVSDPDDTSLISGEDLTAQAPEMDADAKGNSSAKKNGSGSDNKASSNDKNWFQKLIDQIIGNQDNKGTSDHAGNSDSNGNGNGNQNGNDADQTREPEYQVSFVTGDGTPIASRTVKKGTKIETLPTAYRDGYIFTSWYYDKDRSKAAAMSDVIEQDLTLYADYAMQEPLEATEQETFVSATDVNADKFQISVETEDVALTAKDVKAAITASNLTDPKQTDIIAVSGAAGEFTISGKNKVIENASDSKAEKGFAAGATYRITLNDSRLHFKDQSDSVREYNFTTAKEEVLNAGLKDDIIYLSVKDLKNITNDGETVASLSIALYQADDDGKLGPAELTEGSFDYAKKELKVGDIVCIYAGLRPDKRTLDTPEDQNGDVAYVEVTGKNGNRYSYKNAQPEDVIFEPDMLPVPLDADQDSKADTITVANDYLDFSDDVYENVELDSQTTVDEGDFLVFYTGTFGITSGKDAASVQSYGKITSVKENKDDTTTIGFETVTWEEVQQTMDIYASQEITGDDMIEGVDTAQIERSIERQAVDSGFAEEAAQYLGSMALSTENFTKLSENMNLSECSVTLEDGTPVSPARIAKLSSSFSASCEMEDGYPKASISTHPEKLSNVQGTAARNKGLSVKLEVKSKITLGKKGSDNQVVITVTGVFEEEVGLDLGVSSKAIWKVWGIFPYIAEYRVTANVDVLNYTGIEVNAIMTTGQKDEEHDYDDALDIADQIKELIKSADDNNGEDAEKEENSNKLIQRYSDMLEADSDWVRMLEQNIVDQEWRLPPALPIIAVNAEANFVVKMDACISIGFDFEYQTGKRYTYTVDVFAGQVYNDTVSLLEETYEFSFYTMGRLAVKAGVEFEFKVGLFSTDLDSVGFRAEAGAYTKVWGYFYYELKYAESSGRTQKYSGALLIDVGAYLELGLKAQAFNDRYKAEARLLDKEWSLYTVGNQDNVLDFVMEAEEMPDIQLKQHVRSAVLSDSVFALDYLDLKDGKEKQAVYNDYFDETQKVGSTNRKNFDITMTNDKFSYDPQTNTVTVNPSDGDKKLEGEMIITWVRYPLAFSSRPIQRRIHLYWDNLRDGYVIVPYTNGGSYINIINAKYESAVKQPEDPVKLGYDFAGWYSDEDCTVPYVFPESMPAQDTNIYAKWTASTNTPYTVEHYQEQLRSGEYELVESETFTGTTDSYVTPEVKDYYGHNAPAKQEIRINADGSTTLRYYYDLQVHTVTFDPGEAGGDSVSYELKYGATVIAPEMAVKGYTFTGWSQNVNGWMGTEDMTYTAQWTKNADTPYRIEYYVQAVDGTYHLQDIAEREGDTGSQFTADMLRNETLEDGQTAEQKYAVEAGITYAYMTVKGMNVDVAEIGANGKTVIKLYYNRENHNVIFDWGFDGRTDSVEVPYEGETAVLNEITRPGYTFNGWYETADFLQKKVTAVTMNNSDVTLYAKWTANTDTPYTVEYYQADLVGGFVLKDVDHLTGTTDSRVTPAVKSYTGFDAPAKQTVSVQGDGTTVVRYEYARKSYTITFDVNGGNMEEAATVTALYEAPVTLPSPTRDGYGFTGWYDGEKRFTETKMPARNMTLTAEWAAGQYSYTVNHYLQNVDGSDNYTLADTESGAANMDSQVTPEIKRYTGFTSPEKAQSMTITSDPEKNVINYYYVRNRYRLIWNLAGGSAESGYTTGSVYYETPITAPVPVKKGYSYEWNRIPETKMPARDLNYTAKWTANQYKVRYELNGGTVADGSDVSAKTVTYDEAYGTLPVLTKNGYTFDGWFTAAEEGERVTAEMIVKTDQDQILYARFTPVIYQITYENMEGTQNSPENPTGFTIENNKIMLQEPSGKPGYTFDGWYTDASFQHKITGIVTLDSLHDWIFYAKWSANPYTITFDSCLADTVPTESMLMTYDTPATLTLIKEMGRFAKPGYTFMGWATEKGGAVVYQDGECVNNVAEYGNVMLYAVWSVNSFEISYDLGVGGISHNNPASYTIEDGDIRLNAPEAKAGYQFLGWYDGDTLVSEIVRGTQQNYALKAKWAHGGYFSLSYEGLEKITLKDGSDGYKLTYKVTRTLAEGTVATPNPQHVYYRTVNGTAYGSTVDVDIANDKYHFKHAGGEDVYLTFGQNDMEQTFTIEEWGAYAGDDMAATSQIRNTARYYDVELYKIVDTVGTCPASLDVARTERRVMDVAAGSNVIGSEIFNKLYSYQLTDGQRTVTDAGYDKNPSFTFKSMREMLSGVEFTDIQEAYIQKVNTGIGFRLRLEWRKDDRNGNCWLKFTSGSTGKILYERRDISFPSNKDWRSSDYPGSSNFVWTTMDDHIRLNTDASGKGDNDWKFGSSWVLAMLCDNRAPQQVGIANLSFGHYKKGDQISITVIYDEVIASVENVGFDVDVVSALPIENVTYVDGVGTNALTFTATVRTDDFEVTPDTNNDIKNLKPVTGTVKDILGN